ncbi:SDR family oxidoreductase [Jidongwangia harbinensis]|uniref:SDR family oxidoreductase n=1 Tax=Jidongwangia harbinensis TaxID=2878561 RepID=UPI001CD9B7E6|nr:SDR family oxidoreductase [Jidongwangia harbinensis]MCA2216505.1 SDR family oxidoreductase [Jidongwangia harbinensis]
MPDLLINLLASLIAGVTVWLAQRLVRYRRQARRQEFFGLRGQTTCTLSVARHFSSPRLASVHRRDVAALVELATLARECGARADLATDAELVREFGRRTEFAVGGPSVHPRVATHLRTILRGVRYAPDGTLVVGGTEYRYQHDTAEYVALARIFGPDGGRPVFVLAGQTSQSNLAAARYLAGAHRGLYRTYRADRPFCLVLRIVEPGTYGIDFTEVAADATDVAFRPAPGDAGRTDRMDILVAGGHGQIALRLLKLLAAQGHQARGLIRNPAHAADLAAVGAVPVLGDLENEESLDAHVRGADAVVFAAGAGPGSGAARKRTVDLGGAVKLVDAANRTGVRRYVMVSSIGADRPDAAGDTMRPYLTAKAEADDYLRDSGLDYTIVRPGSLTDDPGTGLVRVSTELGGRGPVPRDDVAAVLAGVLTTPATIGATFELFAGDTPVPEALAAL